MPRGAVVCPIPVGKSLPSSPDSQHFGHPIGLRLFGFSAAYAAPWIFFDEKTWSIAYPESGRGGVTDPIPLCPGIRAIG